MRLTFSLLLISVQFISLFVASDPISEKVLQGLTKDLEFVATPQKLVGGDPNMHVVMHTDPGTSTSSETLLVAFAKSGQPKNAVDPVKTLEAVQGQDHIVKIINKWENDSIQAVQVELPSKGSIFGNILHNGKDNLKSRIFNIASDVTDFAIAHANELRFGDLNARNIFLDDDLSPWFFKLSGSSASPEPERNLVSAVATLVFIIAEEREVHHDIQDFKDIDLEQPVTFTEGISTDVVDVIKIGLDQSNTISLKDFKAFLDAKKASPSLETLDKEMYFVPASNLYVGDKDLTEPLSWTLLIVYGVLFLLGSGCFLLAKKPIQQQHAANRQMMQQRMGQQQQPPQFQV